MRKRFRSIDNPSDILVMIVVDERAGISEDDLTPGFGARVRSAVQWLPIFNYADGYGLTYGIRAAFADVAGEDSRLSFPLSWGGERRAGVELERSFDDQRTRAGVAFWVNRRVNPHFELPGSAPAGARRGRSRDRELAQGRRQRPRSRTWTSATTTRPGTRPRARTSRSTRGSIRRFRGTRSTRGSDGSASRSNPATPADSRPTRAATSASAAPRSWRCAGSSRDRMPRCPRPSSPCSAAPTRCAAIAPVTGPATVWRRSPPKCGCRSIHR